MKKIYTAHATSRGGRAGKVETDDKRLSLQLSRPADKTGSGTNPEQLFACGYAACFASALEYIAKQEGFNTEGTSVTANVDLMQGEQEGFRLGVELVVQMPNVDKSAAKDLANKAHQMCPYSKATRGNIEVKITQA